MIYVVIAVLLILIVWVASQYNFFVSTKTRIEASIQEIGNQLKRQFELIPNLEASAKGYLTHEKEIFKQLTEARKAISDAVGSGNAGEMMEAGKKFSEVLPKIQAVVESTPEIKGSEVIKKLMDELRDTSDKVMYARRLLIDLTADYNIKLVAFPSNLVANIFSFKKLKGLATETEGEHLKVSSENMKTPKVNL
jgi:LemA protein